MELHVEANDRVLGCQGRFFFYSFVVDMPPSMRHRRCAHTPPTAPARYLRFFKKPVRHCGGNAERTFCEY
jgi:hypothetical protein